MNSLVRKIILMIILSGSYSVSHAVSYTTNRIEKLAHAVGLGVMDSLCPGSYDSIFYNNLNLNVRVNNYGEICHIGLKLFPKELSNEGKHITWDFVERAFLERLVLKSDSEISFLHSTEKFKIKKGTPSIAASLPQSVSFTEEYTNNFDCSMRWDLPNGSTLLEVEFPRNVQMLLGCNARELENNFIQALERTEPLKEVKKICPPDNIKGTRVTYPTDTLLSGQITNSLYYQATDFIGEWRLVENPNEPSKTLQNLMVSPAGNFKDINLDLTIDCYGYHSLHFETTFDILKTLVQEQGCTLFFGIEGIDDDDNFIGLMLMLNRDAGFLHKMDVKIPKTTLENEEIPIIGQMTLYIPLHNISKDYIKI